MRKKDELSNPVSCMSRAEPDEMTFVLLGRDSAAPYAIRMWVRERVRSGKNKVHDPQIVEALACADTMERERMRANRVAVPIHVATEPTCGHCGEIRSRHYEGFCVWGRRHTPGSQWIPRIEPEAQVPLWKSCTVCGRLTPMLCSDCMIDTNVAVHVCGTTTCRNEHEKTCPGRKHQV